MDMSIVHRGVLKQYFGTIPTIFNQLFSNLPFRRNSKTYFTRINWSALVEA